MEILDNPDYRQFSSDTKLYYGRLLDLYRLSQWDYIFYKDSKAAEELGFSIATIQRCKKALKDAKLIGVEKQGGGDDALIRVKDLLVENPQFIKVPKALFLKYRDINSTDKLYYSLALDMNQLSSSNKDRGWMKDGKIFVKWKNSNASKKLNVALNTVKKSKDTLVKVGLLGIEEQGCNKSHILYVTPLLDQDDRELKYTTSVKKGIPITRETVQGIEYLTVNETD
jgi:hypothetical protein